MAFHVGLGASQAKAYAKLVDNKCIFLTGSAGTGKSEVIRRITQYWDSQNRAFALLGTTGIAAMNIGGKTVHSFFWITPDDDSRSAQAIYERLSKHKSFSFYKRTMQAIRSIVIDEVSMLSCDLLERLSDLMKLLRNNGAPFGGIQVILVGDFFQLPPVAHITKFLFESEVFFQVVPERIVLDESWRQKDPEFVKLLMRMRTASLTENDIETLQKRVGADIAKFGIEPTELWSTNKDVDRLNEDKLRQLPALPETFLAHCFHEGPSSDIHLEKFKRDTNICNSLDLKGPLKQDASDISDLGAQVMLTWNLNVEKHLVNGSRGVIVGFQNAPIKNSYDLSALGYSDAESKVYIRGIRMPQVRFLCPDGTTQTILVPYVKSSRTTGSGSFQTYVWAYTIPLKLAWATTVHKSQGQSLDCARISLDKSVFADGQAYVAVSRLRSLEGLTLSAFAPECIKANSKVVQYYASEHGTASSS